MVAQIPRPVLQVMNTLQSAKFQAYLVGGSVRDILLKREPKDYDIATDAKPNEVKVLFSNAIPTGEKYGTVTLHGEMDVEITTFRKDGPYLDGRRPEHVCFSNSLKEDVIRRDFTINALALTATGEIVDHVGGIRDLNHKLIRCVGDPDERFSQDALRMLRAHRFVSQLGDGFRIEDKTLESIKRNAYLLDNVSWERIRDELKKILLSQNPGALRDLLHTGLLSYILPELEACYGFNQRSKYHDKDVFHHLITAVEKSPNRLNVRLAALFHDIGKPESFSMEGHFYGHQIKSQEIAEKVLKRLRFDSRTINTVSILVKHHMSRFRNLRPKNIKNLIREVGEENLEDLFSLQIADVKASAPPHDLTKVLNLRDEVRRILNSGEPIQVSDLAIDGNDLIEWGMEQGREVGLVLDMMLEKVLDDPRLNTRGSLKAIYNQLKK